MKHIKFFCILLFICVCGFSCKKHQQYYNFGDIVDTSKYKSAKHNLRDILNGFLKQRADVLYSNLGEPDAKPTLTSSNTLKFTYMYLYDFIKDVYDCEIAYFVDQDNYIIKYDISSNACYMITMY